MVRITNVREFNKANDDKVAAYENALKEANKKIDDDYDEYKMKFEEELAVMNAELSAKVDHVAKHPGDKKAKAAADAIEKGIAGMVPMPKRGYFDLGDDIDEPYDDDEKEAYFESDDYKKKVLDLELSEMNGSGWLLDLVASQQVANLDNKNIKSYYAMLGMMKVDCARISKIIVYAASKIDKIMIVEAGRSLLSDNDWIKYHTSYSSSAQLASMFIEGITPDIRAALGFTDDDIAKITQSKMSPYDRVLNASLNTQVLAATHVYLEVYDVKFGKWYQGKRAISSVPPSKVALYTIVFEKMKAIESDVELLERVKTLTELAQFIAGTFVPDGAKEEDYD